MFKHSASAYAYNEVTSTGYMCPRCGITHHEYGDDRDALFTINVPRAQHKEWKQNIKQTHPLNRYELETGVCNKCFKEVLPAALKVFDAQCLEYAVYILEKAITCQKTKNQQKKSELRASLEQCWLTPPKVLSTETWTWIELWPSTR